LSDTVYLFAIGIDTF